MRVGRGGDGGNEGRSQFAHLWRAKYFDSRLLYGAILELN